MAVVRDRNVLVFFVNGIRHEVSGRAAFMSLARYLREAAGLTGTKIVCAEGDCGACTILMSRHRGGTWAPLVTVNSCIAPVYLFDGCSIITVEGLANQGNLSEVQAQLVTHHGSQCGYCTPGIACSLGHLAETSQHRGLGVERKRAQNYLTGNLCRCTGYEPILNAAEKIDLTQWLPLTLRFLTDELSNQCRYLENQVVGIEVDDRKVWLPVQLSQAVELKHQYPQLRIIGGATDLGVLHNKGRQYLDEILVLNRIRSLSDLSKTAEGFHIGAMVSLSEVESRLEEDHSELSRLLRVFASPQIKHQGTLVGNLINASPIADSIPALLVLEAKLCLTSAQGDRWVELNQFYRGYKKLDLRPTEIVKEVLVPAQPPRMMGRYYKASLRKDLDISSVTFAGLFEIANGQVTGARVAVGGVGPVVMRLPQVEKQLIGKPFSEQSFADAGDLAVRSITPISDVRASASYRKQVTKNFFRKTYCELATEVNP